MSIYFGAPLFLGMFLGLLFPFTAIQLSTYSLVFLIVLMLSSGMAIDWKHLRKLPVRIRETGFGLAMAYVLYPILLVTVASLLLNDEQFLYGFMFSTLCPIAMVAPYFSRLHEGDAELAMLLVVGSMLLCPFIIPVALSLTFSTSVSLNLLPLMRYMLLLIFIPLIVGSLIAHTMPRLRRWICKREAPINSLMLGLLIFSLFGTAAGKLNIAYTPGSEIFNLLFLVGLQDFGVLFATRLLVQGNFQPATGNALIVSLSMKNVAIAAGILLIYDPRASFAPAVAFIAHALLFTFLSFTSWSRKCFIKSS